MPRPIRDKVDLENVTEVTDAMAGHDLTPDQEDYFDLLCRLIADYEGEHSPPPRSKPSGLAVLSTCSTNKARRPLTWCACSAFTGRWAR
ncbi:MAG: hypothetical protein HYY24_04765 [Verrucomicrobia bacterium]|nr:hypothetical protein [Verrucomicrobiota bacterium]